MCPNGGKGRRHPAFRTQPVATGRPTPTSEISFYLGSRMALVHPRLPGLQGHKLPEDIAAFNYSENPSTKIDVTRALIKYYENGTCKQPPLITENGVQEPPYDPEWVRVPDVGLDKIIVFLTFPSGNWIILQALEEAGIKYLELNSTFTQQKRAEIIQKFQNTPDIQVLLISNIGMTGLNLACANVIIGVDNLWSAQDTDQLIGRVWRHPQKKTVIYHPIIADKTSDAYIVAMSDDKAIMHLKLANMPIELMRTFAGDDDESGAESTPPPPP
ncbi:hypothetical protein BV20DRAFT_984196, partial [Pilatotrama ljubarskyi]